MIDSELKQHGGRSGAGRFDKLTNRPLKTPPLQDAGKPLQYFNEENFPYRH
jgi:hypothetical protein